MTKNSNRLKMPPKEELIPLEDIKLDDDNPRFGNEVRILKRDQTTIDEDDLQDLLGVHNGYEVLKGSIKQMGYIEEPIKVYKKNTEDKKYTVYEGNTRLKIFREFLHQRENDGSSLEEIKKWKRIPARIYEEFDIDSMEEVRGIVHILGTASWGPFERAKYYTCLSKDRHWSTEKMSLMFGKGTSVIVKAMETYQVMIEQEDYMKEKYPDTTFLDFMGDKYSIFDILLHKEAVSNALEEHQYTIKNLIDWLIEGRFKTQAAARRLAEILDHPEALKRFLSTDHPSEAAEKAIAILPTNDEYAIDSTDIITLIDKTTDKMESINNFSQEYADRPDLLLESMDRLSDTLETTKKLIRSYND